MSLCVKVWWKASSHTAGRFSPETWHVGFRFNTMHSRQFTWVPREFKCFWYHCELINFTREIVGFIDQQLSTPNRHPVFPLKTPCLWNWSSWEQWLFRSNRTALLISWRRGVAHLPAALVFLHLLASLTHAPPCYCRCRLSNTSQVEFRERSG